MYTPPYFTENNQDKLIDLIEKYSFGTLISNRNDEMSVSHLPFLVEQDGDKVVLFGHFAKANDHWEKVGDEQSLVIFQGPHAYISPTWYESKLVPTWHYAVVHIYGKIELIHDQNDVDNIILGLSDKFERDRPDPWIPDYNESMLSAIVGFKIVAERIEGKYKLGQNKCRADQLGVINQLNLEAGDNERAVAKLMQSVLTDSA